MYIYLYKQKCHNGATCHFIGGEEHCECPSDYKGAQCQHCFDLECYNGGVCRKNLVGKSQCSCPDGYNGKQCEINVCQDYCKNGECIITISGPTCKCDQDYWGDRCEKNACTDYCNNGATCKKVPGQQTALCICTESYSGKRCEIDLCITANPPLICSNQNVTTTTKSPDIIDTSECSKYYCKNGGICQEVRNMPVCNCTLEWKGRFCQVNFFSIYKLKL